MHKEILEEIKKRGDMLKRKLKNKIFEIRVFGSRLKGNFHFWSDIDILIVVKNKNEKIERTIYKAFQKIEDKFLIPIHLVIRSLDEWQKEIEFKTPFSREIFRNSYKI